MNRKKIVAGNWKMNLTVEESQNLVQAIHRLISSPPQSEVVVAPTHLSLYTVMRELQQLNSPIKTAAQNVYYRDNGAFTGEVSTSMLQNLNIPYCIVGHSERRSLFAESDETINQKVTKLLQTSITPILCIGETLQEREAGQWQEVVSRQCELNLHGLTPEQANKVVIAYEPVWAIGTGVSASPQQAQEVHHFIRGKLEEMVSKPDETTLLYGGSVNAENAAELFSQSDIDGGLVGGASLKPEAFVAIVHALKG